MRSFVFDLAQTRAAGIIRRQTFVDDFFGMVIYAEEVDTEQSLLTDVFIADEKSAEQSFVVYARQA